MKNGIALSRLLQEIRSENDGDYCYINCFRSFRTEKNLNHMKVHKNYG